jgi:hypothetical protein
MKSSTVPPVIPSEARNLALALLRQSRARFLASLGMTAVAEEVEPQTLCKTRVCVTPIAEGKRQRFIAGWEESHAKRFFQVLAF